MSAIERLKGIRDDVVPGPFQRMSRWIHVVPPRVVRDHRDMHAGLTALLAQADDWDRDAEKARELCAAGETGSDRVRTALAKGEAAVKVRELVDRAMSEKESVR